MSPKVTFVVCLHAFFIQYAYSQLYNSGVGFEVDALSRGGASALRGYNLGNGVSRIGLSNSGLNGLGNAALLSAGLGSRGLAGINAAGVQDVAALASVPVTGPFTATGNADVSVGGEFITSGSTVVGGQIPVIGAVSFSGQIPASGVVSIAGNCGCNSIPL